VEQKAAEEEKHKTRDWTPWMSHAEAKMTVDSNKRKRDLKKDSGTKERSEKTTCSLLFLMDRKKPKTYDS
jgi:hypothetical protein